MTYYSVLAAQRLGAPRVPNATLRTGRLRQKRGRARASIDYFATSLPTMLIFREDISRPSAIWSP